MEATQERTMVERVKQGFILTLLALPFVCLACWVTLLAWEVSIFSIAHHVPCDQPLAFFLFFSSLLMPVYVAVVIWHWSWSKRYARGQGEWHELKNIILTGVVVRGLLIVNLLLGNYWNWSSVTCKETSKPFIAPPANILLSLYDASHTVAFVWDVEFLYGCLMAALDIANMRARGWHEYAQVNPPSMALQTSNVSILTIRGMVHWVMRFSLDPAGHLQSSSSDPEYLSPVAS